MIVEFFLGLGLAGAIEAFINASIVLILRMAGAMILSILSSLRIVESFSDCMVSVGSIKVWFLKPPRQPPDKCHGFR